MQRRFTCSVMSLALISLIVYSLPIVLWPNRRSRRGLLFDKRRGKIPLRIISRCRRIIRVYCTTIHVILQVFFQF